MQFWPNAFEVFGLFSLSKFVRFHPLFALHLPYSYPTLEHQFVPSNIRAANITMVRERGAKFTASFLRIGTNRPFPAG
jgi:hypothetical protein